MHSVSLDLEGLAQCWCTSQSFRDLSTLPQVLSSMLEQGGSPLNLVRMMTEKVLSTALVALDCDCGFIATTSGCGMDIVPGANVVELALQCSHMKMADDYHIAAPCRRDGILIFTKADTRVDQDVIVGILDAVSKAFGAGSSMEYESQQVLKCGLASGATLDNYVLVSAVVAGHLLGVAGFGRLPSYWLAEHPYPCPRQPIVCEPGNVGGKSRFESIPSHMHQQVNGCVSKNLYEIIYPIRLAFVLTKALPNIISSQSPTNASTHQRNDGGSIEIVMETTYSWEAAAKEWQSRNVPF